MLAGRVRMSQSLKVKLYPLLNICGFNANFKHFYNLSKVFRTRLFFYSEQLHAVKITTGPHAQRIL